MHLYHKGKLDLFLHEMKIPSSRTNLNNYFKQPKESLRAILINITKCQ